jgi:serine/threonine protein kinase
MIEKGTFLQQRYRIDRQIGQGGMGAVYIAKDERFDSTVAIKETLYFSDGNFRKAIEREARLLNSLKHPALPRVSDHFEEQNGQFLVMEYIPGDDLGAMLDSQGKAFPVEQVLKWADQLLDALDYLHTQDMPVVHRDIKPQNLKINSRGEAILLDFGLAKGNPTDAGHLTAAKSIFGYSRNYASLEQIQGTGTDPRSDLYSLAATLYHLLTNAAPEDALSRAMSVLSKKGDPLVPASRVNPAVPRGVAGVLQMALDLDAAERPATAVQMREMLRDNQKYAHLADAVTEAVSISDPHLFAQPTQLMSDKTQVAGDGKTGIATEVFPVAVASVLTSLKPVATGGSLKNTVQPEVVTVSEPRKRRLPIFAGAISFALVAIAIAGTVYIADPSFFGVRESEAPQPAAASEPENRSQTDADVSSIGLEQNIDPAQAAVPRPETERGTGTAARNPEAASRTAKTRGRSNVGANDEADGVLDIRVDDPDIPKGGVVLSEKDENGKVTMMRVNPKPPRAPITKQFDFREFNPFPNGFEFKNLTPAQRRKLQEIVRERKLTRAYGVPPPKPSTSP